MKAVSISSNHIGKLALTLLLTIGLLGALFPQASFADEGDEDSSTLTSNAAVVFEKGDIVLDSVPSFDFGEQAISSEDASYNAEEISGVIQVSDLRGTGEGWDLQVSLSPFELTEGSSATLEGAYINIIGGTVIGTPVAEEDKPELVGETITIASDNEQVSVFSAAAGSGRGVWGLSLSESDVSLNVIANTAHVGESSAVLTWSLTAAP